MKKIIMSAGTLVFAGALVASATGAFFSDVETSSANTFTAGSIDLQVDSQQHYNNAVCVNGSWELEPDAVATNPQYPEIGTDCGGTWDMKDLIPGMDKFFNFPDVKPGDSGENTVSLHVTSNDAYACADITNIEDLDNSLTDPENELADTGPDGEMGQNLDFIIWADNGAGGGVEGDNIWNGTEPLLTQGTAPSSDQTYTLADPNIGALVAGDTAYLGVAWCAGDWENVAPGTATCNGATMGNIAQTDSYKADISFRVEQARNNPNFTCNQ